MNTDNVILETARQTIAIEIETLADLKDQLGKDFEDCAKHVYNCSGRIVVAGIGKSALVAQKMVATFNSTGTPALFMHAADAIHGDLGMIMPSDVVLCVSKSGETAEIKVLIPLLKNLGNKLIAMVSNPDSFLGRKADFLLLTPVKREADPNNLAPTASTTAQMAMGDALATVLLAMRGFSSADFAQFHPGGALGKQLYLRVWDIYPNNEKPAVHPDSSIRATILEMTSKRLGATAVVGPENELLGIITDGDLRRMLEKNRELDALTARDVMSSNPHIIAEEALAVKALHTMRQKSITQLVVVDGKTYRGIIHLHDLIKEGLV